MAGTIDFSLLGVGEPSPYQQAQARDVQNQLAQQQLATGRMQQEQAQMSLAQAKRDQDALRILQQKFVENGKSPDLETNFRAMIESGIQHYVDIGMKGIQMLEGQKRFRQLMGGGAPVSGESAPQRGEGLATVLPVPDTMPTNALANQAAPAPAAPVNELQGLENKIAAAYEIGTPQALAWAQAREKELAELRKPQVVSPGASVFQGGKSVFTAPKEDKKPTLVEEYEFAKTPAGGNFKGTLMDFKRTIAEAGRTPASAAPVTPVTVVDPKDPTRTVVIDGRTGRVIGQGPKEPGVGVELTAKEKQAREAKYPQATAAVKTFEAKSDALAADIEKLANHPGLSGISGVLYGRTPAITKDARAAQALYDSIVARGGFAELQAMRQSSPTGGALGNVSNQEGQYLRDAFAALNRTQDTADLKNALTAAAQQVRDSKQRTREAYDATYEYRAAGAATPTPGKSDIRSKADAIISEGK